MDQQETDAEVEAPWRRVLQESLDNPLHWVVLWLFEGPEWTGLVAPVAEARWLGRGAEPYRGVEPARFFEQRPGVSRAVAPLGTTRISRRQLRLTPLDGRSTRVENVGRRALYVNGTRVDTAVVGVGDTLMLEDSALFLVDARPVTLPPRAHYPEPKFGFGTPDAHGLVGESPALWQLREQLAIAAHSDAHVLLLGETGAGKELAASAVHGLSSRRRGAWVERNAATIPETLLDAELFGNAKNYPHANAPERPGLVGAADGGHLLLDEIGELGEDHQAHLLRVLDARGQYQRLGETRLRTSDFRLIAATNREPARLKPDFLARFGNRIQVPGLNRRKSDIPFLVRELVARMRQRTPQLVARFLESHDPTQVRLHPWFLEALVRHDYQQHLRELQLLVSLSVAGSRGAYLELTPDIQDHLAQSRANSSPNSTNRTPSGAPALHSGEPDAHPPASAHPAASAHPPGATGADRAQAQAVSEALRASGGNITRAAEALGMSRYALRRLMTRLGWTRS